MQQRLLVRARSLAAFRRALAERATAGTWREIRDRAVVVPTRAAGELLRQTIEARAIADGRAGVVCPDFLTRDDLWATFHASLGDGRRWLSRLEREVLLTRAAREVLDRRRFERPPFRLRPGLVSAMLDFHDELGRRQRTVRRLARAVFDELRGERGTDRGSEQLIDQARFLAFAFLAYRRLAAESGGVDEAELRRTLLTTQPALACRELVVAVADHPADPRGLWPADFDLIGRLSGIRRIEVVMTDEAHDAGFRERLEGELPGIVEERAADVSDAPRLETSARVGRPPVFVSRDREEELRDVARTVRARASGGTLACATAIVFHRPLPYLYLAQQVLADAGIPYQAFDALPLAAEPFASLVDLFLTVAGSGGTAESVAALTGSPLFMVHANDPAARSPELAPAAIAAAVAFREAPRASTQVAALTSFLRTHAAAGPPGPPSVRLERVRAAVLSVLDDLASAFGRHDDAPRATETLTALIHHAIEGRTFAPERGARAGVRLVDAEAARFGDFEQVFLVGLVETDWTERPRRNVFFPASLLAALGWPPDRARVEAQRAAFRDVLTVARQRTRLSAFELDGDTLVGLSTMIGAAEALPTEEVPETPPIRLFTDERLDGTVGPGAFGPAPAEWLRARLSRPPLTDAAYAGTIARRPAEVYRVSRVDRYVTCPFKYFAERVLRLPEARRASAGLDPLERGTLLHGVFETFYERWQRAGHGAITALNLADAEELFAAVADEKIAELPEADRSLERLRLTGSIVAPGVADRVFELEVAAGRPVVRRLIEVELAGTFRFPILHGLAERDIAIKGKADRIDVLDDGSIRVVDYKLGRMPDLERSIQIGVYAHCARQQLEAADGRPHPVSGAAYLAFGDERRLEGSLARQSVDVAAAVETRASAFASAVERIEAGDFPPRPLKPAECTWCGFAVVCRKEYRLEDEDEPAESV